MRRRRGLMFFVAATGLSVAVAGPALGARPLAWKESAKVHGDPVLSFEVETLSVGKSGWSARISVHNFTHRVVRVGNVFALTFYKGAKITPTTKADAFGQATKFSPRRPATLAPGATWSSVISGRGRPQPTLTGKVYARVVFGPFYNVPGWPKGFFWITDHSRTINLTPKQPNGLVI
jgi:hypothetical protein